MSFIRVSEIAGLFAGRRLERRDRQGLHIHHEVVTVESVPVDLVALEGQGSLKLDSGSARSRWDSLFGSCRNLSVSRVGQERESGDSRSHGSDAFDEGASPWGR